MYPWVDEMLGRCQKLIECVQMTQIIAIFTNPLG